MTELQFSGLLADLIHREIYDPAEFVAILFHVLLARSAKQSAEYACGLLRCQLLACGQTDKVTRLQSEGSNDCLLALLQELGNTSHKFAVLVQFEPVCLVGRLHFHLGTDSVDHFSGRGKSVHDNRFYGLSLERTESAVCHNVRRILQYQINAEIRLVGAVLVHGLQIWNTHKRSLGSSLVYTILFKYRRQYLLDNREHILLGSKCHLHIELIELSRRTVCSCVLITETRCNLEIAVESGRH